MIRRVAAVATACAIVAFACSSFDEGEPRGGVGDGGQADGSVDGGGDGSSAGCTAQTSTDPANCGLCGHDCLGGACVAGICQPSEIGRSTDAPVKSLAVDGTRVFWMTSTLPNDGIGNVYVCPKTGCPGGAVPPTLPNKSSTGTLAGDGTTTFASLAFSARSVTKYPATGDSVTLTGFGSAYGNPFAMELQGTKLWVVGHLSGDDRTVVSADENDVFALRGTFKPDAGINTFHASVTSNRLFLGAINTPSIVTCQLDGCDGSWTEFVAPASGVKSMTNDDATLYWIDHEYTVRSCSASGASCPGITTALTSADLGGVRALTVQYSAMSKTLIVLTAANEVLECETGRCAGSKRALAKEPQLDLAYALYGNNVTGDDKAVYYVAVDGSRDAGDAVWRIMRVAR